MVLHIYHLNSHYIIMGWYLKKLRHLQAQHVKKKKKIYNTFFGTYLFRDVPKIVYPLGVKLLQEGDYSYQIATPEKALCDKLYTIAPLKNMTKLENLLFNDLRIDVDEFKKLSIDEIKEISKMYHSTNVSLLYRYMRRNEQ